MYGGHTEFWFTKKEYKNIGDKGELVEAIIIKLEELTEQFPEYDMIRVIMETRKHDTLRPSKTDRIE